MEDKKTYNKVMLIVFCLIAILLCAGIYNWFYSGNAVRGEEVPRETVQDLSGEF